MIRRTFEQALKNFKPSFTKGFKSFTPMRAFSTVNLDGLRNILKSEVNHEETSYSPIDQNELKQFFSESKFQFVDKPDSLNLELKKTHDKFDVIVNFQAKPPMPQDEQAPEEGQEKMPENMTEFTVRLIKKGGKSGLLVDASTMDTSFEFNTVQFSEDVNALFEDYINQKPSEIYTGPAFNSLDERLQSELTNFLTSIGINEDLMSFMNVMSIDKDQKLYLNWLKNIQNFLA